VRRFLPWVLLGVVGVGAIAAAVVGQVESPGVPASVWVDQLLSTTAAAGTAHLQFSSVTTSPDPSERSAFVGRGVVDFTNGDNRITQLNHQVGFESTNGGPAHPVEQTYTEESVAIGQTVYRNDVVILAGQSLPAPWIKSNFPRDVHQAFGLDAGSGAEDAVAGLAGIESVAAVQTLGPGRVDGAASTRYLISYQPLDVCAHGRTVSLPLIAPTTVWVDGQGRLLQARVATHSTAGQLPGSLRTLIGGASTPVAPSATVTTLTFSDFGAPVHIVAPNTSGPQHPQSFSIAAKARPSNGSCAG
jgi:hypothetical protein